MKTITHMTATTITIMPGHHCEIPELSSLLFELASESKIYAHMYDDITWRQLHKWQQQQSTNWSHLLHISSSNLLHLSCIIMQACDIEDSTTWMSHSKTHTHTHTTNEWQHNQTHNHTYNNIHNPFWAKVTSHCCKDLRKLCKSQPATLQKASERSAKAGLRKGLRKQHRCPYIWLHHMKTITQLTTTTITIMPGHHCEMPEWSSLLSEHASESNIYAHIYIYDDITWRQLHKWQQQQS